MLPIQTHNKEKIIALLLLVLVSSLFISRVVLSIATITFCIVSIALYYNKINKKLLHQHWAIISIATIVILTLLSGLYSTNTTEWASRLLVKMPLIVLPIGLLIITVNHTIIYFVQALFILLVTIGTVYTMSMYYLQPEATLLAYNTAQVLPTILNNDHIQYSITVVIALLLLTYQHQYIHTNRLKNINIGIGIWLIIFLHILMCKTGLLLLYTTFFIYASQKKEWRKPKIVLSILLVVIALPAICYNILPTVKKRIDYIKYDYSVYSKGLQLHGMSDGVRLISLKAGVSIVKQHPIIGVGYGNVKTATYNYYATNTNLLPYEKILPSSQYVIVAAATGLVGLLLFVASLVSIFFVKKSRKNIYFVSFYLPILFSFIWEIHLEGQYGVFIFTFFTVWFYKYCTPTQLPTP